MGDVAHHDRAAIHRLDRQLVELVDHSGAVVQLDRIFVLADLGGAGGHDLVLRGERRADVGRRRDGAPASGRIQIDLDLPLLAAIGRRHGRALHGGERRADRILAEIEDLLLGDQALDDSASCRIGTVEAL
jgi:hypothetical protein